MDQNCTFSGVYLGVAPIGSKYCQFKKYCQNCCPSLMKQEANIYKKRLIQKDVVDGRILQCTLYPLGSQFFKQQHNTSMHRCTGTFGLVNGGDDLLTRRKLCKNTFTLWLNTQQPGKVLNGLNAQQSEISQNFQ